MGNKRHQSQRAHLLQMSPSKAESADAKARGNNLWRLTQVPSVKCAICITERLAGSFKSAGCKCEQTIPLFVRHNSAISIYFGRLFAFARIQPKMILEECAPLHEFAEYPAGPRCSLGCIFHHKQT